MDANKNSDLYRRIEAAQRAMWAKGLGVVAEGWNTGLCFCDTREQKEAFVARCEERARG